MNKHKPKSLLNLNNITEFNYNSNYNADLIVEMSAITCDIEIYNIAVAVGVRHNNE